MLLKVLGAMKILNENRITIITTTLMCNKQINGVGGAVVFQLSSKWIYLSLRIRAADQGRKQTKNLIYNLAATKTENKIISILNLRK